MKHMKTVQVPASEREVVDKTTCDICKAEINPSPTNAEEVEVKHRSGYSCPDGGNGYDTEFDLCGKCFDSKLIPLLAVLGAEPRQTEWDF